MNTIFLEKVGNLLAVVKHSVKCADNISRGRSYSAENSKPIRRFYKNHSHGSIGETVFPKSKTKKPLPEYDPEYTRLLPNEQKDVEDALLDFENGVNIEDESSINW